MIDPVSSAITESRAWRDALRAAIVALMAFGALLAAFLAVFDPYGIVRQRVGLPAVMVDQNQRLMLPQAVRSRLHDSAVIGTSTIRLLDPVALNAVYGGRFVNLAMNAATPWEQRRMLALFLRETSTVRTVVFGVDLPIWCREDATSEAQRLTGRGFPTWLFDDTNAAHLLQLADLTSLEMALRRATVAVGLGRPRIRPDGYASFLPADERYDAALAKRLIHDRSGAPGAQRAIIGETDDALAGQRELEPMTSPALAGSRPGLDWLRAMLLSLPAATRSIVTFMPVHSAIQPEPNSPQAKDQDSCKSDIAAIVRERGGTLIDFRIRSSVTIRDENYWDPLHDRAGIGARIVDALAAVARDPRDDPEGFFRVPVPPRT